MSNLPESTTQQQGRSTPTSTTSSIHEQHVQGAQFQPPFPQQAVSPEPISPNQQPRQQQAHHAHPQNPHHPHIEDALNATAAHVAPEVPAPQREEPGGGIDVSREGIGRDNEVHSHIPQPGEGKRQEERDPKQQPIISGTPLDELKTPMFERSSAFDRSRTSSYNSNKQGSRTPVPPVINEHEVEDPFARSPSTPSTPQPPAERLEEEDDVAGSMGNFPSRSDMGMPKRMGSVRMGASALISALNAIPWDEDGEGNGDGSGSDSSDDSDSQRRPQRRTSPSTSNSRPKATRMHSSLHTIRPMTTPSEDMTNIDPNAQSYFPQQAKGDTRGRKHPQSLQFPFRENTIARKARSPGPTELAYQFAKQGISHPAETAAVSQEIPPAIPEAASTDPRSSIDSQGDSAIEGSLRQITQDRVAAEQQIARQEEGEEIDRAAEQAHGTPHYDAVAGASHSTSEPEGKTDEQRRQSEENVAAALREGDDSEAEVEDRMLSNPQEKKRVRREILAERLQEVFGLENREPVLEEMRCWLLRSVMLKGYMYLTPRHICFFAHMPDKENLIVKTGPLSKKNSKTKMYTKFWAVLKNDVLSWYESTADPYFPRGNISLQYASSCDAVDDTRFKLRTSERNYTFTADTPAARDEWIKAIQKVMFKTQHEGESVKLIIPVDAILEVDKAPTLEFAETIEIKCVDPEDQMSMDSYFFASFQDGDRTIQAIQRVLEERQSDDVPHPRSPATIQEQLHPTDSHQEGSGGGGGPLGLKKLGSVLKPLLSKTNDQPETADKDPHISQDSKSSFSLPFVHRQKPSHDSLETLRVKPAQQVSDDDEDEWDGYPPRQSGIPPAGMGEKGSGWGGFLKKPSKIFGTSPSQSSLHDRSPRASTQILGNVPPGAPQAESPTSMRTRTGRGKRESVTEVVEPTVPEETDSDGEYSAGPRMSFTSDSDLNIGSPGNERSGYSLMERSESGTREDDETAQKFRKVFALPEKEELIDHFPGYLYRVLPVSGRFFLSTNYFCFRSSQLLYKTKMMIPIRDLYGLKAQKAFRFGHSGLIIVIKGHEELFLEFSSSKRRDGCVALLEQRMEAVRLDAASATDPDGQQVADDESVAMRIMEDLDETAPIDPKKQEVGTPSMMFGSTTSTFLEFKPESPMRITCLTIGSRGDVQPYIALCKGLQAEGHTARIASHGEYREWVEGHGIEFACVGGDPAELMQMCVDNGMFTVSFLKEGLQKFRGWLDDLLESSWEACQGSDLLIESPSAMGGIHIAEALRIPYFRAFTMPWTRTRAYPHAFAVPEHKRGGSYNYMTYTMFDQVFWRAIAGQVNRFRRKTLHIDATNFDKLEQHKVPFLYNFSPNVVPPPLDWTEWIHVTGYWFLENADESASKEKWTPPEGLVDFIDGAHEKGKKVVYIGFGSIVVSDPQEMTRCVVEAVKTSGVYAILSKGWSDRGSKAKGDDKGDSSGADGVEYPDSIFPIDSIDHSWLFPRIDAACHHGGAGTSGASLRAGIPTIIKPFFGDQAFWSERVESLNVGSAVRKLTAEVLSEALIKATTDEKQISKAKIVGEMIRKENGVARAIEAIYRDLEYAKSLIKPPPDEKEDKGLHLLPSISGSDVHIPFRSKSRDEDTANANSKRSSSQMRSDGHISDSSWDHLSEEHEHQKVEYDAAVQDDELLSTPERADRHVRRDSAHSGKSGKLKSGILGKIKAVVPG